MGKRKQPFGYKMELGEIVPQPQEAETVRSIYLQYLAGASFKQLAEQLQTEDVPYDVDKPWNKNMVARILEDDRYIGEKYFPALIPTEQFHAAQERRKEMRPEYKQTPAQKELRRLCGGIVPDSVPQSGVDTARRETCGMALQQSLGLWQEILQRISDAGRSAAPAGGAGSNQRIHVRAQGAGGSACGCDGAGIGSGSR